MSRVLCPLLLVLLVPALGSCDGGTDSPLGDALSYLPADAAVAVAVSSNLDSEAFSEVDAALQRFGVQGGIQRAIDESTPEGVS